VTPAVTPVVTGLVGGGAPNLFGFWVNEVFVCSVLDGYVTDIPFLGVTVKVPVVNPIVTPVETPAPTPAPTGRKRNGVKRIQLQTETEKQAPSTHVCKLLHK
jgi:hypothetical protein